MKIFQVSINLIPVMGFEKEAMAATGLTLDQTRFALSFIGAVLSGVLVRWIRAPKGETGGQQQQQQEEGGCCDPGGLSSLIGSG